MQSVLQLCGRGRLPCSHHGGLSVWSARSVVCDSAQRETARVASNCGYIPCPIHHEGSRNAEYVLLSSGVTAIAFSKKDECAGLAIASGCLLWDRRPGGWSKREMNSYGFDLLSFSRKQIRSCPGEAWHREPRHRA